jgi:hypothetical protein
MSLAGCGEKELTLPTVGDGPATVKKMSKSADKEAYGIPSNDESLIRIFSMALPVRF